MLLQHHWSRSLALLELDAASEADGQLDLIEAAVEDGQAGGGLGEIAAIEDGGVEGEIPALGELHAGADGEIEAGLRIERHAAHRIEAVLGDGERVAGAEPAAPEAVGDAHLQLEVAGALEEVGRIVVDAARGTEELGAGAAGEGEGDDLV